VDEALPMVDWTAILPPQVRLLVLFGSRVRGTARARSDWDLGVLLQVADLPPEGREGLWVQLIPCLAQALRVPREAIDLVDLDICPPLLAGLAAQGKPLYEEVPGIFDCFQRNMAQRANLPGWGGIFEGNLG
jgi:predicted nucleotidyltransferase